MNALQKIEPQQQEIQVRNDDMVLSPVAISNIKNQVAAIQGLMRDVLKEGEHYGTIPGCGDKKVLMKSGAEKLGLVFRLRPTFEVRRSDLGGGHREYEVICTLNGVYQGVGSCSTMEAKYRYRTGPKEDTGKPVPKEYWDLRSTDKQKAQEMLGGKGFTTAKNQFGGWTIHMQGERVEHDNPADHYNTVLKMAKKRAFVDAVITATATSDIFTQDLEEIRDEQPMEHVTVHPPAAKPIQPAPRPAPKPQPEPRPPEEDDVSFDDLDAGETRQPVGDGPPEADRDADPEASAWWKDVIVPIPPRGVKMAEYRGHEITLGQLAESDNGRFFGFCTNFVPTPYQGKIKDADVQFRLALDAACDYCGFQKPARNA